MENIDWLGIFVNWLPMIVIVGIWFFFIWQMRRRGGYATQYQRDYMEQMKKQTELMERIAASLEKKI